MKLGIGNYYLERYGLSDGAKKMAADGYSFIDFQLTDITSELYTARDEEFLKMVLDIKKELNSAGVTVNQIHGPFCAELRDSTEEERAVCFEKMVKGMVMARHLGASYMAVHPLTPFGYGAKNAAQTVEINRVFYTALAKVGGKLGVTVCLENLPFCAFPLSEVFALADFIREINSPYLKMTFDTGHANCFEGKIGDKIRYAGELIKILHIHDNDGTADSHLNPYDGVIDWADLTEALFDIGYSGVFNLETNPVSKKQLEDGISDEEITKSEKHLASIIRLIAG